MLRMREFERRRANQRNFLAAALHRANRAAAHADAAKEEARNERRETMALMALPS